MTRDELLELAALDAFGLLDEYEAALYTRSFHHAPASVQDEVRSLQAAFSGDLALLPDVEPGPELRARVLEAVSKAIEADSFELAPLALIGQSRLRAREGATVRRGFDVLGQFWRAAAFILAAALIVVLYFGGQRNSTEARVLEYALDLLTSLQVEALLAQEQDEDLLGPDLWEFLDNPNVMETILLSDDEEATMVAFVMFNQETEQGFLFTKGLPNEELMLTVMDANGDPEKEWSFAPKSAFASKQLGQLVSLIAANWQITNAEGLVLLHSA